MTLQCVIMFSICLLSCPQHHLLSWAQQSRHISRFSRHSSPLTAFTISHFSELFSRHILAFFPFKLPPRLILLLAFLSSHSPRPLSPTHPLNQSFIPFSFSSPSFYVSNFTLPIALFHPLFFPAFCVSWPVSALCFPCVSATFPSPLLLYFFHPPGPVLSFSSVPCLYHLFPPLDLLPSLFYFPFLCLFPPLLLCPHPCVSGLTVCSQFSLKQ